MCLYTFDNFLKIIKYNVIKNVIFKSLFQNQIICRLSIKYNLHPNTGNNCKTVNKMLEQTMCVRYLMLVFLFVTDLLIDA